MSASGIGAAVRRKEDQRFITGIGHYTADLAMSATAQAVVGAAEGQQQP
jgi:carbon-monoxide dehydrogenase large subunit